MRPARRDEALRLQRPDQRDREGGGEDRLGRHAPEEDLQVAPHVSGRTTSGSYASRMPNCFSTPARTSSASLSRSALRSEEHTSELQSHHDLVCRLLLEKKNKKH